MITKPTTFVVGAGASKDYGLPTSAELREEAHRLIPEYGDYQLICEATFCTLKQLNNVLHDLRNQGTKSIDEFLFARQDDAVAMKVGRALIALLLGHRFRKLRSPDSLDAGPIDWLGYIINKMQSGAPDVEEFKQGNTEVRFVTFNFDSIVEDRFEKAIRNLYRGAPETQLQNAVNAMHSQIIHVHGRLPRPPGSRLQSGLRVPEGTNEWIDWLKSAPSEIRVLMDQIERDTLDAAQVAVKRSEILCFLGFAYASDNLKKLGFPEALHVGANDEWVNREVYGTAFGMRPGEIAEVKDKFERAELGGGSELCLDFLRNHHIFRG